MLANPSPFSPRELTKRERRREDLYLYNSPKMGRRVEVVDCLRMALGLGFEFDPTVVHFVERPRKLDTPNGTVEFDFWTREARGRERFWLLVPLSDTLHPRSPRREHRRASDVIAAAQEARLSVEFRFEEDMQKDAAILGTWYRLLPYVQTATCLPNRHALRTQVLAVFDAVARATFDQIEGTLKGFHGADVRAVTVDLVHAGKLVLVEPSRLHRFSVLERRNDHGKT